MISVVDHKLTWKITPELVAEVVSHIRDGFNPEKIILFGSATGDDASKANDLDLLIVMKTNLPPHKRATPIRLSFQPYPCSMDILVYTPDEIRKWNGTVNHIITEAFRTGKVMYDKSD